MDQKPWWPPPNIEPQGQYLADMSGEHRRTTSIQIARSLEGIAPSTQLYRDVCYPGDTLEHQTLLAKAQTVCSLLVGGWMRLLGCAHPLLDPEYWGRTDAHSRIEQVARDSGDGCWGGHDGEFVGGDAIMIGTDVPRDAPGRSKIIAQWGTPGHAAIVLNVKVQDDQTMLVTTLDGGRSPFTVKTRTMTVDSRGRKWLHGWTTRRVWGSIRVDKLKIDPDRQWYLPKGPKYPGLT